MIGAGALHWYVNTETRLAPPTEQERYGTAGRAGDLPDGAASPMVALNPKSVVRVAVGPLGLGSEEADGRISDLLLAQLSDAPGIETIDRSIGSKKRSAHFRRP
jgi:hypothetical protein